MSPYEDLKKRFRELEEENLKLKEDNALLMRIPLMIAT